MNSERFPQNFQRKISEKFLKISSPFFFALKFVLRLFKHIVFRRRESFSNLKKAKRTFFSSFQLSSIPKIFLFFRRSCIYSSEDSNSHLKTYFGSEKFSPRRNFSDVPKNKTKKEVKKYGLGIISCIASNI
jgi:hypothetical protein